MGAGEHGDMVMRRWWDHVTADRADAHQQTGLQFQPRGWNGYLQRAQQDPNIINNYHNNYHNHNNNNNYYYHYHHDNNHNGSDNFYSAGLC